MMPVRVIIMPSVFARDSSAVKSITVGVRAKLSWIIRQACGGCDASKLCISVDRVPIDPSCDPDVAAGSEIRVAPRPGTGVDLVLTFVALVASFAANQFLASRVPSISSGKTPEELRAGFGAISNDAYAGEVIPVVFGTHKRYGGKVIARVPGESPDGSGRDTVRVLVCLGHGPFARIGNQTTDFDNVRLGDITGVQVNDQEGRTFAPEWRCWGRMGSDSQDPIPGLEDVQLTREVGAGGVVLRNTSGSERAGGSPSGEVFSFTTSQAVNAFVLRVRLPEGLYKVDSEAQVESASVAYRYRWREVGGSWGSWSVISLQAASQSPFWSSPRVAVGATALQVEVQAERVSIEPTDLTIKDKLLWGNVVEVIDAEETYAGLALFAIEIVAGEQVQNEPRLSFDVDGYAKCKVWDGESPADAPVFVEEFSRNPSWQALTYLLNPVWGCGGSESLANVYIPGVFSLADECDTDRDVVDDRGDVVRTRARFACDLVLNEQRPASEHLRAILGVAFAAPVKTGKVWRFVGDVQQVLPTETFTDGSIAMTGEGLEAEPEITVTRELTTKGLTRPNQIVVQFDNMLEDDRPDTITYPREGELWLGGENAESVLSQQVRLEGVRDPDQAAAAAIRLLNMQRYRERTLRFRCTHPAIAVLPGERFDVATSLLDWGLISGRVLAGATTTSVRLDRSLTIQSGVTYTLRIVHTNNTEESKPIQMPVGTYAKGVPLQLASALTLAPVYGAEYVVEQTGITAKPFICTSVASADTDELLWDLEGVEYVDFYDDEPGPVTPIPYSGLVHDLLAPGPLATLSGFERRNTQTNVIQAELAWSQRPEDASNTATFRVYRRVTGTTTWVQIPEAVITRRSAVLDIIRADRGYDFRVVAVSSRGVALSVDDPRHPTFTLALGTTGNPPGTDITDLTLTRISGNSYTLSWTAVAGAVGYIVYSGATPSGGVYDDIKDAFIVARTTATRLEGLRLPTGVSRFYVRSVAGNGRMSFNQANTSVDNTFSPVSMSVKHTHTANFGSGVTNVATASGAYVPSDVTADAVWESGEIDTGSDTAGQVTLRFTTANRAGDPDLDEFTPNVPSIEADQWGIINNDRDVGMIFPPFPDDSHQFVFEIAFKIAGVYGAWQTITPYALVTGSFRYYKLRLTWRRGRFPYRPGVAGLVAVTFA